ncbi:MAG: energy transducer TonB [Flavobacteriaceae bacterium]
MSLLDTRHKKKSFTLTTILLSALLLLMFYIGLSYLEPPIESGITVNFGALEFGMGEEQPKEKVKSQPVKKPVIKEATPVEEVKSEEEAVPESASEEKPAEKLLTQDNEESIKIKQQKEEEKRAEEAAKKAREEADRKERERKAAEEKARQEQEAKKEKLDALLGGLNSADGDVVGGEGDDQLAGDKGSPDGDPYATTYYGSPGSGSGTGGYGLSGRSLAGKGKVQQECNEEGRVVVKITVDRNGKVIKAEPGVKGTTNNNPCLLDPARKTALLHRWNEDSNAPGQQIGFVVVNFKLGE